MVTVLGDKGYVAAPAMFVQRFPVPEHREDFFAFAVGRTMPLFLTLGFIYSVSMIVKKYDFNAPVLDMLKLEQHCI